MKLIHFFRAVFVLCWLQSISPQVLSQTLDWSKSFKADGNGNTSRIMDLKALPDGGVVCLGQIKTRIDFDPGLDSVIYDFSVNTSVIWKLNVDGELDWVQVLDSINGRDLAIDYFENIYICGAVHSNSGHGIGLAKYDSDGELLWKTRTTHSSVTNSAAYNIKAVNIDFEGNVYTVSSFLGSLSYANGQDTQFVHSPNGHNVVVIKQNSEGEYLWMKSLNSENLSIPWDIVSDKDGNIIVSGAFRGAVDFDLDTASEHIVVASLNSAVQTSVGDGFVLKMNKQGDFQWVQHIVGQTWASVYGNGSLALTSDGSIICVGDFLGSLNFPTDTGVLTLFLSQNISYSFVEKLDPNGKLIWLNQALLANAFSNRHEVQVNLQDEIYLVGSYTPPLLGGDVDINPGSGTFLLNFPPQQRGNGTVVRLNAAGDYTWAGHIGGTYIWEKNQQLTMLADGTGFFLAGVHGDSCDIDPSPTNVSIVSALGDEDWFVSKFHHCALKTQLLTLQSDSLSTSISAESYQWVDCENNMQPIAGETSNIFVPDTNGFYASVVYINGCVDTSDCFEVATLGESSNHLKVQTLIYPNPVSNTLTVDVDSELQRVRVFGIRGDLVLAVKEPSIELGHLKAGIYILEVTTDVSTEFLRIVKR